MNQWIDEYRTNELGIKANESLLLRSTIQGSFHLNKIYSQLSEEEKNEKKLLYDNVNLISTQIKDTIHQFSLSNKKGSLLINKGNYPHFKERTQKINYLIQKTRIEFRSIYDKLLEEELYLNKELDRFDYKITTLLNSKENDNPIDINIDQEKEADCAVLSSSNLFNEVTDKIMSSQIISKQSFPEERLSDMINDIIDLNEIKEKVSEIDDIMIIKLKGQNLSWQAKDHQEFIKMVNHHNGKFNSLEFYNDLENSLPYLPSSELREHIKSYTKYFFLNEMKKMLLVRYKGIKKENDEQKKQKTISKLLNNDCQCDINSEEQNPNQNSTVNKLNLIKKKEEIAKWKMSRMEEKFKKEEEEKKLKEEKLLKEKQLMLKRLQENKQKIEEIKKIKEMNEAINTDKEIKEVEHINFIDLERIKERNELLLNKRKEGLRTKSATKFSSEISYSKYKLDRKKTLCNVESKLLEKTENSNVKQRDKFYFNKEKGKDAYTMANNVLCKVSRIVPEWRKNL